jgi:hypothetical protein
VSEPYCAECGNTVPPDEDHVHVVAETKHMQDRDDREDYYFHMECWWEVSDDWEVPA